MTEKLLNFFEKQIKCFLAEIHINYLEEMGFFKWRMKYSLLGWIPGIWSIISVQNTKPNLTLANATANIAWHGKVYARSGSSLYRGRGCCSMCSCQPTMNLVVSETKQNIFLHKQPIFKWMDNCTRNRYLFPVYIFPGQIFELQRLSWIVSSAL
jgi:hypothetical protein